MKFFIDSFDTRHALTSIARNQMFRFFRDAIRSTPLGLAPCEATLLYFIATSRATERGVLKNSRHSTKCSNARFPTGCTRSFLSREMKSQGAFSSKGWRKRRRRYIVPYLQKDIEWSTLPVPRALID